MTRWTQELLDEAQALAQASRYRSALGKLLVILDVYPDQPETLKLASSVVRLGSRRTTDAAPGEALEPQHLFDSRLDPVFCSCDAPGCEVSWVSAHHMLEDYAGATITNPLGARCPSCDLTLCRRHLPIGESGLAGDCERCGALLDAAPPPNGRETNQTPRLNKRLVDVIVLVEGKRPPAADFLTELCGNVMPDVFEDAPHIHGLNERKFKGDGYDLGLIAAFTADDAYGTDDYDVRVYPGHQAGRRNRRWVIVKIFENRPKHVDPHNPATGA
ncbi:hypothetical protein E1293_09270 [Actinomadura darangshiensis]|uniref:Uncharacterized protein n=1 Tax=Actinomadura darangshiensis TaxID=705336 RepID=A0A4R5BJA2_9ACTN|nr:hypothetical protein [Actinomadura darangshiensis]TDD86691.1 hypothetical protein E1293_09270 [Actinomadura darangshiensis]